MSDPADKQLPAERRGLTYTTVEMERSGGGAMLLPKSFGDIVAFSQVMASADIALPKHLRSNAGACMAVTMQSLRWEMDPFAVANKTYLVNDRLAYEAQLVNAVVLTRAPLQERPTYTYSGEGPTRRCKVEITMKGGQVLEYETPMLTDIKVQNSPLWKADPDQQLGYYAIRSWARRHTPEVIMGVYTPEEVAEMKDITPQKSGVAERLAASAMGSGGFSPQGVEDAIDGHFEPVPEVVDDPAPEEPVVREVETSPEPEEAVDPLRVPMADLTPDERVAWSEAFRAKVLRAGKDPSAAMAVWTDYFELQIGPLGLADPALGDRLDAWMQERMKRLRAAQARDVQP